jgi:hypothetical protein
MPWKPSTWWRRSKVHARRKSAALKRCRLRLEALEARCVPAVYTWTGKGSDDNWSNASNWDLKGLPSPFPQLGDEAVFNVVAAGDNNDVSLDVGDIVSKVTITSNFTGTILLAGCDLTAGALDMAGGTFDGGGDLFVNGGTWSGGTMQGAGMTSVQGTLAINAPPLGSVALSRRTLDISEGSTVNWVSGTISDVGADIINQGTFDAQDDSMLSGTAPFGNFENRATFKKSQTGVIPGSTSISMPFNNWRGAQTIVQTGSLDLSAGGWSGGTFLLTWGTINFTGGTNTYTWYSGTTFTGRNYATLVNAKADIESTVTAQLFQMTTPDARIVGAGVFWIEDTLRWNAGSMSDSGYTYIDLGAHADIGGAPLLDRRTFSNFGTVTWLPGAGNMTVSNGGSIHNWALFDIQNDSKIVDGGGAGTFLNYCTFCEILRADCGVELS